MRSHSAGPSGTDTVNVDYYPGILVDTMNNFDITCFGMNNGSIDVTVNAVDDFSDIDRVEFYIDNDLKSITNSSPYIYTWTIKTLFRHRHAIKVVAFDNAGNIASGEIKVRKFL